MKPKFYLRPLSGTFYRLLSLIFGQTVLAQTVPTTQLLPDTAKMTYNQISQQMKLYVYPAKGQSKQQQKKDEFECYQLGSGTIRY